MEVSSTYDVIVIRHHIIIYFIFYATWYMYMLSIYPQIGYHLWNTTRSRVDVKLRATMSNLSHRQQFTNTLTDSTWKGFMVLGVRP